MAVEYGGECSVAHTLQYPGKISEGQHFSLRHSMLNKMMQNATNTMILKPTGEYLLFDHPLFNEGDDLTNDTDAGYWTLLCTNDGTTDYVRV